MKTEARPKGHDYATEIRQRFGSRPALLAMDQLGSASAEKRKPYQVAEGVAIIDISGVLVSTAEWWDETEYREIINEVAMAVADADVKRILLRINSPGGQTDGAFEAAIVLAGAAKKKPMWAVADGMAYSAAYLLASQARKIYTPPITGGVGSIGVYGMHADYSEMLAKAGINITFVSEGEGKIDGNPYQPLSAEALAGWRAEIARLYGEFVGFVARGRNIPEQAVRKLGAHPYPGTKALRSGLADVAGSLDDAWIALATMPEENKDPMGGLTSSAQADVKPKASADGHESTKEVGMEPTTQTTADKQPAGVTQIELDRLVAEARSAGTSEAAEIVALCSLAGYPEAAVSFLGAKKPKAEVIAALQQMKAAKDAEEINNKQAGKSSPPDNSKEGFAGLLLRQAEQIAAQMKGGNV